MNLRNHRPPDIGHALALRFGIASAVVLDTALHETRRSSLAGRGPFQVRDNRGCERVTLDLASKRLSKIEPASVSGAARKLAFRRVAKIRIAVVLCAC